MNRRKLLIGVGGILGVGACIGAAPDSDDDEEQAIEQTPEPTEEPDSLEEPEPTRTPEEAAEDAAASEEELLEDEPDFSDGQFLAVMEKVLNDEWENASVRSIERATDNVALEYETWSHTEEDLMGEIAGVAGALAVAVDHGWDVDYLFGYIYVPGESSEIASFSIDSTDAQDWVDGTISNENYLLRVLGTLEVYD